MPTITFATPPGRPSVLRANTVQQSLSHDVSEASTSKLAAAQSMPVPDPAQHSEPAPLVFQKRNLPQLTTSPEPAQESFDLPPSRLSLDDSRSHRPQLGEAKKPSLLSTAIVSSSALPPRSASTTNLGILRRAEIDDGHSGAENGLRATTVDGSATPVPPRPRLHFVEPRKEAASVVSARPEPKLSTPNRGEPRTSSQAAMAAASEQPTQAEPAPRKRSLIIQEHADVLERAAERAARNNLSTQALEQHSRTGVFARSRQHSTSSAGEETASARSSWALRSSSHGSSIGTLPTVASEDLGLEPSDIELSKPVEESAVVSIFNNAAAADRPEAPATSSRKLTFIHPAPSRRRSPPRPRPLSPTSRMSDREPPSSSDKKVVKAVSDDDALARRESSGKVLAFAACPKPERSARLSPAHAMRKKRAKLSASPAPHKLAYPQRLRGIRGTDPIRSPAPDKVASISAQMESWDHVDQDVSSEASGYSEDEEDDDSVEQEDDETSRSIQSDIQSITESLQQSEDDDDADSVQTGNGSSLHEEDGHEFAGQAPTNGSAEHHAGQNQQVSLATACDAKQASSHFDTQRRASTPALDRALAANAALAAQRSPPRNLQLPRSNQTSPRSGSSSHVGRKLKPKDSFSHPMCFLPDAFEDSAPPTPTEPDSEGYEPPRASLLQGWLSEGGGSAASSRRTSWQQPHPSPGLRAPSAIGEEGLAVPITLPPFRRTRERTAQYGVTSDGEQSSRSLGGNAAFIRESAGLGRSLNCNEERLGKRSAAASPFASPPPPQPLGISVSIDGRPTQPVTWRHLSNQHAIASGRPSTALAGHRRASHSVETRRVSSAFTSPIGSYSHQAGRIIQSHGLERSMRSSACKQRAVSTSSHIRSRPSVAPSTHDDVVVATSPPREDASAHLKHQLAHSPKSGATTPGWMSDGQLPSQTASRYWSERLSSLAQAMSEELSMVGNAVLGTKSSSGLGSGEQGATHFVDGVRGEPHRRSRSVPLQSAVLISSNPDAIADDDEAMSLHPAETETTSRRNSIGTQHLVKPKPIAIAPSAAPTTNTWTAERDGETQQAPITTRRARQNDADVEESSSIDEAQPFQFARKEVGEDGTTRLVVIHTSDRAGGGRGQLAATGGGGMQFDWGTTGAGNQ